MLDHARPYANPAMCDTYLPGAASEPEPLDDFQVFRKKWTASYTYGDYYSAVPYDAYAESELGAVANVYHDLAAPKDYSLRDDWRSKYVADWSADDTVCWLVDIAQTCGIPELDIPLYNFKVPGVALRGMRREHVVQMMEYPGVDPSISRRNGEIAYERLQARLAEEYHKEAVVPVSVLRYVEGDTYQAPLEQTQVLDLDGYSVERKARLYPVDYRSMLQHTACDSSDDADDPFRLSESASPDCSYGSDTSKSGDELDDKRRVGKRPPGRPKGTGKKLSKRIKSVSVPEFLRDLLLDPNYCPHIIKWEDYTVGKFRFVKPDEVSKLWGSKKQNDKMSFEKFSRAMRYHYRQGVLVSVPTARLVYQFGPKGPDYRTENPNFSKVKCEDLHSEPAYT